MNYEKFTHSSLQQFQSAQQLAVEEKNSQLEPIHLVASMLADNS